VLAKDAFKALAVTGQKLGEELYLRQTRDIPSFFISAFLRSAKKEQSSFVLNLA